MNEKETIEEMEKRDAAGYARISSQASEFEEWQSEQVWESLTEQAFQTYERISRRLERAVAEGRKFPARGLRTSAYAALQSRINQLTKMQANAYARYMRRSAKKPRVNK